MDLSHKNPAKKVHTATPLPLDQLGRPLHDLRVSVTDRCNFRCTYCMPKDAFGRNHAFLPRADLLSFEEIAQLARVFVELGVRKIRLTGGEPLLRKNLGQLIRLLRELPNLEVTLTTNGALLARHAQMLFDAGLNRLTVSLDSLDEATFRKMNDVDFPLSDVLHGIDTAQKVGFTGIKINTVVRKGLNEHEIPHLARHFRGTGNILRFIEFMDVGQTNGWNMGQVVPSSQVLDTLQALWPLVTEEAQYSGEVATRWKYLDGQGEIGLISSVSQAFCRDCSRLRLSPEGQLFTCLFATRGHDLRGRLRHQPNTHEALSDWIRELWEKRNDRYSELRSEGKAPLGKIEMSYIGG